MKCCIYKEKLSNYKEILYKIIKHKFIKVVIIKNKIKNRNHKLLINNKKKINLINYYKVQNKTCFI